MLKLLWYLTMVVFASNIILSCLFFFFLYLLITAVITQNFNPTAELVILTGAPTKKAKAEMVVHPVIVETKISKCSI